MTDWICSVGTKGQDDVLWSTWVTEIEDTVQLESTVLSEASAAGIGVGIEIEVRNATKAEAVANFPSNASGDFMFAMMVNGAKPTGSIPRVVKKNGPVPGSLMRSAIDDIEAHPDVKQHEKASMIFMCRDEAGGA